MKHRFMTVVASVALAAGFTVAGHSAAFGADSRLAGFEEAVPAVATAEGAAQAIYIDENGSPLEVDETGTPLQVDASSSRGSGISAAAIGCTPESGVDNPHISTWSTGPAVQAHGWWKRGTCKGDTAHVTVCLYEYLQNSSGSEHYWERKDCSPNTQLRPGGGSGNRVTAHEDCDTLTNTSWRAHVTVDVDWEVDTGEVPRKQDVVACRVN